jgi:hypothetical protein
MAHDILGGENTKNFARQSSLGGSPSDVGSLLIPAKQERALLQKIDDVRYDVRTVGGKVSGSVLALAAALGLLGVASIYRTANSGNRR